MMGNCFGRTWGGTLGTIIFVVVVSLSLQGCAKKNEIPFDGDSVLGRDYQAVVSELKDAGFDNLKTNVVDTVDAQNENKVADIQVDGKSDFKAKDKIDVNTKIVITYYQLEQLEAYIKIHFEGENEEPDVMIETNLPDDIQLDVAFSRSQNGYQEQKKVKVSSGQAKAELGRGFEQIATPGNYEVTVEMNAASQTERALSKIGPNGDILTGNNVQKSSENGAKCLYAMAEYTVKKDEFLKKHQTDDARTIYLLEKAIQEKYGLNYTIEKEHTGLTTINIWSEELSEKYTAALTGDLDALREWYAVRQEITSFTTELAEIAPNYWVWVNVTTPDKEKTPLLTVAEDVVEYDGTKKEIPTWATDSSVNYIGVIGYAAVERYPDFGAYNPAGDIHFATTQWTVPTYQKDKQFYVKNGVLAHKTKIEVIDQNLTDQGHHYATGYLTVKNLDTGEETIINAHNFVTVPYWELDVKSATKIGEYVAKYQQLSDYWPEPYNKKERAQEGANVLVMEEKDDIVIGLIYQNGDWIKYGFQSEDLTIVK